MASVCILDDDRLVRSLLSDTVTEMGHRAAESPSLTEGLRMCAERGCDVVFLDVLLPDGNGLLAIERLRGLPSRPEVVIITGHGDPEGAELAIRHGAWDFLEKPLNVERVELTLRRVLAFRQQQNALGGRRTLKRAGIIGESRALRACLDLVAEAAASDVNVLISGETGTGKELFARAIHENSARADQEFIALDCASMTESLLESRLFGHTKGSFTGAAQTREGVFRFAHKGTLLMDEVGEMPSSMQRSFLRVLEERRFRPIGARDEVESDFRLVAATNRNLPEMVQLGLFRSDLLFRLRGLSITLPPLRERREDIPQLADYLLDQLCLRYGECGKELSGDFMETLLAYSWPGNVRELLHAVERAFSGARNEPAIYAQHLPVEIRVAVARDGVGGTAVTPSDAPPKPPPSGPDFQPATAYPTFRNFKAEAEKNYIEQLLLRTGGSIKEAVDLSGLSRGHLYELMKKYNVERP